MIKKENNNITIDNNKVLEYIDNTIDNKDNDIKRIFVYNHDEVKELTVCKELRTILMHRKIYDSLGAEAKHWGIIFEDNEQHIHGIRCIMVDMIDAKCENCKNYKTLDCPNSKLYYNEEDKPYFKAKE